jgi:uncharacterized membrane protein SpoIIM required for sporulation
MAEDTRPTDANAAPEPTGMSASALQLKSQKFREAREGDWRALNAAITQAESKGLGSFSDDALLNLPVLYRSAISSLSMARSISLDRNLITYLEALCGRAYVYIYGPQSRFKDVFSAFFIDAWPKSVRAIRLEIFVSLAVLIIGAVAGWLLCAQDASFYSTLIPPGMTGGRTPEASIEDLRETLGDGGDKGNAYSIFAAYLMSHNIQVCVTAFVFGALFGVPTFLVMLHNAMLLGAMLWLFYSKGLGIDFSAWLTIHGTTELMAIVIAGGCGFHMARRMVFPGHLTRLAALREAGQKTGTVMLGVWLMLMVAGLLEGYGRQLVTATPARFAIGFVMLALWLVYFTQTRPLKAASPPKEAARG